jgi:hypothetical protein
MDLFGGISDKELGKRLSAIASLTICFGAIGLILNLWHPNIAYFNNLTLGNWIFLAEFFGWALFTLVAYVYHASKFL